MEYGVILMFMT